MNPTRAVSKSLQHTKHLSANYPWITAPLIVSAPMRTVSGPHLAAAVSHAGGLGFIGPGEKPQNTHTDLATLRDLHATKPIVPASTDSLPVGVGFQTWNADIESAVSAVAEYRPSAAWLFAPRNGQQELDTWTAKLREAHPAVKIWLQVGTVREAVEAANSAHKPDVLVLQGAEAGGHGRAEDGIGIVTLLPEVADALAESDIPLIAAGGIVDGRGVCAALGLGAAGVAMGTRFLASTEARIAKGYQDEVVRAGDGAVATTRTQLYNHLRGTFGWPEPWSPRGLTNRSWEDHKAGVPFEELKSRHDDAVKAGDAGWGLDGRLATYVGASVGLVRNVMDAEMIVHNVRTEAREVLDSVLAVWGET